MVTSKLEKFGVFGLGWTKKRLRVSPIQIAHTLNCVVRSKRFIKARFTFLTRQKASINFTATFVVIWPITLNFTYGLIWDTFDSLRVTLLQIALICGYGASDCIIGTQTCFEYIFWAERIFFKVANHRRSFLKRLTHRPYIINLERIFRFGKLRRRLLRINLRISVQVYSTLRYVNTERSRLW